MKRWYFLPLMMALCAGTCDQQHSSDEILTATLRQYASVMRWGDIDQALVFVAPETLEKHPVTPLDLERYHQLKIVGYTERGLERIDPGHVRQVVTLEVVNQNTQIARTVVDQQEWRLDPKTKHWWLVSGLPKVTQE